MESYFEHFVLAGGWAMIILIPASLATIAALLHAALALRDSRVSDLADPASPASRLTTRLQQLHARHATLSADDARAEVDHQALRLFAMLQPLGAMIAVAPLAGALGTITSLMGANTDAARANAGLAAAEWLPAAVEHALIPSLWGVAIALIATAAHAALRARVWFIERHLLIPTADRVVDALLHGRRAADPSSSMAAAANPRPRRLRLSAQVDAGPRATASDEGREGHA